jgi:hypothetical protein
MKSLLSFVIVGLLAVTQANAAHYELALSTEGSGTVQIGSTGDRVSKVNVLLKKDGKFTIGFVGGNDTRFGGTWTPSGRNDVVLRLTEADGRYADGSGELNIGNYRGGSNVDRLVITGETEKGRALNARFSIPQRVPAPPPPAPARMVLNAARDGVGHLEVGGRPQYRFNTARVQLYTDGRAVVQTGGATPLRYEGTWTSAGETTSNLSVAGGVDGERLRGVVRHRGDRFWKVELSGNRSSRYYSFDFDPGR